MCLWEALRCGDGYGDVQHQGSCPGRCRGGEKGQLYSNCLSCMLTVNVPLLIEDPKRSERGVVIYSAQGERHGQHDFYMKSVGNVGERETG